VVRRYAGTHYAGSLDFVGHRPYPFTCSIRLVANANFRFSEAKRRDLGSPSPLPIEIVREKAQKDSNGTKGKDIVTRF